MSTIWAAPAPTRVLNLRGAPVAERRPGDDDDDDDDATGSHDAKPSSRAGDESPFEDVAGAARGPRVGRIDAWRDQGFASAREQREALKSDLGRYNARRRRQGRAPLTEDEFDAMIARGGDEVSSISGSDSDSDSDDGEGGGDGGGEGGARTYAAVRGAEQGGAQIVFKDDAGEVAYAVWRCVLEDPSRKDASSRLDANGAVRALMALRDGARPWAVVLARGGHFAASVFDPTKFASGTHAGARVEKKPRGPIENVVPPASAILHKTFHRYVVRAKAGGRQSAKDAGGGKTIKSAGSSMRRANERALEEEIRECLSGWRSVLNDCALIFVSASKTDQRTLFDAPGKGKEACLGRGDERVRRVPFATRRPTFNETRRVVARLASASHVEDHVEDAVGAEGGAEGGAEPATREVDAGGGALTDAQRDRMAQIESRAASAAAALRGLDFGAGDFGAGGAGGEEGDDAGDASGGKTLSKKEKEKLKRQRAKERAKAAAAAADGEKGPAPPAPPAPPEPARSRVGKSGGGGKAAALLAKAKQGEANKRNEAVRTTRDEPPRPLFSHPNLSPRFPRFHPGLFVPETHGDASRLISPGPRRRAKRGVPPGSAGADSGSRGGDARGSVRRSRRVHRWRRGWRRRRGGLTRRRCCRRRRWPRRR